MITYLLFKANIFLSWKKEYTPFQSILCYLFSSIMKIYLLTLSRDCLIIFCECLYFFISIIMYFCSSEKMSLFVLTLSILYVSCKYLFMLHNCDSLFFSILIIVYFLKNYQAYFLKNKHNFILKFDAIQPFRILAQYI